MNDKDFQIDVLTRLTAIETLLKEQDYKAINERLNNTENKADNNEKRLDKIENNTSWLWKTVVASVIGLLLELIVGVIAFLK